MTTGTLTRPAAGTGRWVRHSACRAATADRDFYGSGVAAQARARRTCLSCPVRVQCLAARSTVDAQDEPWGVVGGLGAAQRRVLDIAELIGEEPALDRAEELLAPRWRYRLHNLRTAGYAPLRIAEILTRDGITVDAITVRVALWWSGASGTALARRTSRDRRPLWQRVLNDHADVIRRLRAKGARHGDVSDYLGVPVGTIARVLADLERPS